jgi:hypothetical protein
MYRYKKSGLPAGQPASLTESVLFSTSQSFAGHPANHSSDAILV